MCMYVPAAVTVCNNNNNNNEYFKLRSLIISWWINDQSNIYGNNVINKWKQYQVRTRWMKTKKLTFHRFTAVGLTKKKLSGSSSMLSNTHVKRFICFFFLFCRPMFFIREYFNGWHLFKKRLYALLCVTTIVSKL